MKKYSWLLVIISLMMVGGCKEKKASNSKNNTELISAYSNLEKLDEKAARDTAFKSSEAYASQMGKIQLEISKMSSGMSENDKLLQDFEFALKSLKTDTEKYTRNKELLKDKAFVAVLQSKGNKVKDCSQSLKRLNLNAEQTERFNRLSKQ